jgi:hypothetical protein
MFSTPSGEDQRKRRIKEHRWKMKIEALQKERW